MRTEINRKELLRQDGYNWIYLIHGKIYNESGQKFRTFRFVIWIDISDIEKNINELFNNKLNSYINKALSLIINYDEVDNFYNYCNNSINKWNEELNKLKLEYNL